MDNFIERWLLATRWLLVPLYAALILSTVGVYVMVGREIVHMFEVLLTADEAELVLIMLTLLDLVLLANLVVMVAISSYESFVSRIQVVGDADNKPEWLGKLDSSNVKVKVALSVVMISAINLLRVYMSEGAREQLLRLAAAHLVFLFSALAISVVDRLGRKNGAH